MDLRGLPPSTSLLQPPSVFRSILDRVDWPEFLWRNCQRLLNALSSICTILRNSIWHLGDSEGMTWHNKGRTSARYYLSAANFSASFISRVGSIWEGETRKLIRGRIYHPAWKSKQSRGAVHHSRLWHHQQPASAEPAERSPKKGRTGQTGQGKLCVLLGLWPWDSFPNGPRVSRTLDALEKTRWSLEKEVN